MSQKKKAHARSRPQASNAPFPKRTIIQPKKKGPANYQIAFHQTLHGPARQLYMRCSQFRFGLRSGRGVSGMSKGLPLLIDQVRLFALVLLKRLRPLLDDCFAWPGLHWTQRLKQGLVETENVSLCFHVVFKSHVPAPRPQPNHSPRKQTAQTYACPSKLFPRKCKSICFSLQDALFSPKRVIYPRSFTSKSKCASTQFNPLLKECIQGRFKESSGPKTSMRPQFSEQIRC